MAKVNVSLSDDLLRDVDELARTLNRSRSGFVQEAAARYVATVRAEQAEAERRSGIQSAIADMRALSAKVGTFDSTAKIRADRDADYAAGTADE
jgi:metal-responsive CopG/Arc/MetJ family transcriptional regulator